jgi:hypothetical protein
MIRRSFFQTCLGGLLGLVFKKKVEKLQDKVGISFRVVSVYIPEGASNDWWGPAPDPTGKAYWKGQLPGMIIKIERVDQNA